MPSKPKCTELPRKRPRSDPNAKPLRKFTNANEIRAGLRSQNQDGLTEALTALRNQLTLKTDEPSITPQDERLLLLKIWMDMDPGAHDIFEIWEKANQRQLSQLALLVSVVSSIITLLNTHYTYHSLCLPVVKTLVSPPWMRRLNSYLGYSHMELILVTLKLLNGLSAFGGGREQKSILEGFAWETKSLPKLLQMRRKNKNNDYADNLARPDIRTLYILLILSFVDIDSPSTVKQTFLEQHRDVFLSIFKGLVQDSYALIRRVLEVCWNGVWFDQKIKRTLKIGLFNEMTISQILKLYDRVSPENGDSDHIVADLVHHFLLAICTRPGIGICFKDRGWYPRESDDEHDRNANQDGVLVRGKIFNKILTNVLKTLKVNEDSRQQELALKMMSACPELVAGYWSGAALTLEPRLSYKWIANIAFFGAVVTLPIPSSSFLIGGTSTSTNKFYHPSPPALSTILENVLPSVNTKSHFSKGLQSTSGLVQHCTSLALVKCLRKYNEVMQLFEVISRALEEGEDEGQWYSRRKELEKEVRRRVPDFQVVVAFSQLKMTTGPNTRPNPTKVELLAESAQRLLWMYHQCLPEVVAETRFDVGKLLANFEDGNERAEPEGVRGGLHIIRQLHVLRLLKESDQFRWSGKPASSNRTYTHTLLKAFIVTMIPAIQSAISTLLNHVFAQSILFQEDGNEPQLWLESLPTSRRVHGAEAPDGAALTDEGDSVIGFLDDCIQRCLNTPYRYIEEIQTLTSSEPQGAATTEPADTSPSPLLMTVVEQLDAKISNKLLSMSDTLALTSFVRKLLFRLSTKQQSLRLLHAVADKVDVLLQRDRLFPQHPILTAAIRRETRIMHASLRQSQDLHFPEPGNASNTVQDFLNQVNSLPLPSSRVEQVTSAFELIDWWRLMEQPLHPSEINLFLTTLERLYPPALSELCRNLYPESGWLWRYSGLQQPVSELVNRLSFDWLFLQSSETSLENEACRRVLVQVLFTNSATVTEIKRAVCLICHRLAPGGRDVVSRDLLLLLALVVQGAQPSLSVTDLGSLKEYIFLQCAGVKRLCLSSSLGDVVRKGLDALVHISLDPKDTRDRKIAAHISGHWVSALRTSLGSQEPPEVAPATLLWIKYLACEDLFDLLDTAGKYIGSTFDPLLLNILRGTLDALRLAMTPPAINLDHLRHRLHLLVTLRSLLPDSSTLEDMIAIAVDSFLPVGLDGICLSSIDQSADGASLSRHSEACWSPLCNPPFDKLDIRSFLTPKLWTESTVRILSALLYKQQASRSAFLHWLGTENASTHSNRHLVPVIHSYLDSSLVRGNQLSEKEGEVLVSIFPHMLHSAADHPSPQKLKSMSMTCISLLLSVVQPKRKTELIRMLESEVHSLRENEITLHLLEIVVGLVNDSDARNMMNSLVDHGLRWAVRFSSGGMEETEDACEVFGLLTKLVQGSPGVKLHLAETVLGVIIQSQLNNSYALRFAEVVLQATAFKPVIVNRYLQSVLQHPQFFKLCAAREHISNPRDHIVKLVHTLFHLHPFNTCQPSHVEPLVRIYRGTISNADRNILSIFQLFEVQRKASVTSLLVRWSPLPDSTSSNALDAIHSLDPVQVLRSCLMFPSWRRLDDHAISEDNAENGQLYDPVFIILLFACMLSGGPPTSAFGWVELFRTNVVCLLVRSMSSKDGVIRDMALCQITGLWKCLQTADMQENSQVTYILNLLRDIIPPPSTEPPRRLPCYTSLIILHALRGVFYPSNFIFPLTARFILQRPELDTNDIPMLYSMLYSSSDDWKKERGWIIRFLSDGMMSTDDWKVFRRRHTWELLSSLFQSSPRDRSLRNSILEVLANLTSKPQATMSLVLKSGLLTWIEMELINLENEEGIAWARILENILVVANHVKLESSTNGEWRSVISRCLCSLLSSTLSMTSILASTVPCILRLSLLPGPSTLQLSSVVSQALKCLRCLESTIEIPQAWTNRTSGGSSAPHGGHGLHEPPKCEDPVQVWGEAVESLWRVTMSFEEKPLAWDALTCRLLVWRSMVGKAGCQVGEWVRKEVVRNLCMEDEVRSQSD